MVGGANSWFIVKVIFVEGSISLLNMLIAKTVAFPLSPEQDIKN